MKNKHQITIEFLRRGELIEYSEELRVIDKVYTNLYALDFIVEEADKKGGPKVKWMREKQVKTLRTIKNPYEIVLPDERIRLKRIQISSPGWLEVIGSMNPLETIRKYLQDRHQRKRENSKEQYELERLALENEKLKQEVLKGQMDILRELGVPEEKIRQAMTKYFLNPVLELDSLQDKKLIGGAQELNTNRID